MNRWDRKWQALAVGARAWDGQERSLQWEEVKVELLRATDSRTFPANLERESPRGEEDWLQCSGWGLKWAAGLSCLMALLLFTGVMKPAALEGGLEGEAWLSIQAQAPFQTLVTLFQ